LNLYAIQIFCIGSSDSLEVVEYLLFVFYTNWITPSGIRAGLSSYFQEIVTEDNIGKSKNRNWSYRDFSLNSWPVTCSITQRKQQGAMEGRMGHMEQSVKSLDDGQLEIRACLAELFDLVSTLSKTKLEEGESSRRKDQEIEGEHSYKGERQQPFSNKHVKLDFPRFNEEEDPTSWVYRAEQFFRYQGTPEEEKTTLASFHLEGQGVTWKEFTEGLFARFGPTQFYDPFGELTKLQQEGSVREYQTHFKSLLSKIKTLFQNQ
jgi:hypothetical protein